MASSADCTTFTRRCSVAECNWLPANPFDAVGSAAGSPLRVLLVHNAYQQRGGEDAVCDAEEALLRELGHPVHCYRRHNDEVADISPLRLARDTVWSPRTTRDVAAAFASFRPDVVHVHNSFPLVSPSIHWAAHRAGVPVVQTLHNFRLICPQALLLRDGRVCEDCVGHVPWRAVAHRCYRGSAAQSAVVAVMLQTHRALGTWREKVTRYIALNEFCKAKFVQGGLPAERISVKPNFVDLPAPEPQDRRDFLFVGRLSVEKGIEVLARAEPMLPEALRLLIAGTGPESNLLRNGTRFCLLGALAPKQVYERMAGAAALVLPSICYENFPRTLVEAFANGLPVVASRLGALESLVQDGHTGLLFEPGNAADLAAKLLWATNHPEEMRRMGRAARQHYEQHLTGAANYRQLIAIYDQAMAENVSIQ
jgi:glycosyltransferase involved in cell wall biosynthesis